jgi:hypothetical protein
MESPVLIKLVDPTKEKGESQYIPQADGLGSLGSRLVFLLHATLCKEE